MNNSSENQRLEEILRSSKLVSGGFMGNDTRSVTEIIDSDSVKLQKLGFTAKQIAERMQEITQKAIAGLGIWVEINNRRQAIVNEAKGFLICPWSHPGKFAKRVTTVRLKESGADIRWADLNIHLIAEHGFFEGKGSAFRIEPEKLINIIFSAPDKEKKSWEHFPHQADIGIRGIGKTKEEAFEQAAVALTAVITDPKKVTPSTEIKIACSDTDDELLFVDWINCIIYEIAVKKMLFSRFEVKIQPNDLKASAWGEKIDVSKHHPVVEVKAATYTSLSVAQNANGLWIAQCVVDV